MSDDPRFPVGADLDQQAMTTPALQAKVAVREAFIQAIPVASGVSGGALIAKARERADRAIIAIEQAVERETREGILAGDDARDDIRWRPTAEVVWDAYQHGLIMFRPRAVPYMPPIPEIPQLLVDAEDLEIGTPFLDGYVMGVSDLAKALREHE